MKAKSAWAPAKAVFAISGVVTGGFAEASSQASAPLSGQIQSKPCWTYMHMPLFRAFAGLGPMHNCEMHWSSYKEARTQHDRPLMYQQVCVCRT